MEIQHIARWLIHVHSDDPVRKVLNQGFATVLIAITLIGVFMTPIFLLTGEDVILLGMLIWIPACILMAWFNRRGSVYGAAIFCLWFTLIIPLVTAPNGYHGVEDMTLILLLVVPIIMAILFIQPAAGIVVYFLQIVSVGFMLSEAGLSADVTIQILVNIIADLAVVTVLLIIGSTIFRNALYQAGESEKALRQLTDATFEAIVIHDKGIIVEVNPALCQMCRCKREDAIGKSALEFVAPEWRELAREKIASGDTTPYEGLGMRFDGSLFPVELVGKPINYRGRLLRLVALHDLTERKLAETQRLELALINQKTELLKEFLNMLSHDFKTPLSVINTCLYLIEKTNDPEQQKSKIETIRAQVEHLKKLIQDILMVSRLDSMPVLTLKRVHINRMINQIHEHFHAEIENRKLNMEMAFDPDLPPVLVSETELHRALVNLIENALHYTPADGTITIRTLTHPGEAVVEVSDTGIGIAEKDLPHIFEHFYRADKARATDKGGTGLGLAIVKKIMDMHKGSVEVESTAGAGTTFRLKLPTS